MSFASPLFLWAFTLLIPLITVYFLKVKPRKHQTTALFLWQSIYDKKHNESLFNRLRDLISLLLMLLLVSLLVLAMAKPQYVTQKDKDLLILIDNSASMQTSESRESRLQEAKDQANKIVQALGAGKRAAIATVADDVKFKTFMSSNQRLLGRALDKIQPTELPFDRNALKNLFLKGTKAENVRVILISDGVGPGSLLTSKESQQPIEFLKVGKKSKNVGFISCDLQIKKMNADQMSFYFQLANASDKPVNTEIYLYHLDQEDQQNLQSINPITDLDDIKNIPTNPYKVISVTISPGINDSAIYDVPQMIPGKWMALLNYDDAMILDNTVYMTIKKPNPVSIGILAKERYFFEHSVQAFSQSSGLINLTPLQQDNITQATPEITVCQTVEDFQSLTASLPKSQKNKAIIFNPSADSSFFQGDNTELETGSYVIKAIQKDDPALRFYDVTTIPFYGAKKIQPTQSTQVIAETDNGIGLIWRMTDGNKDCLIVNMDPGQSNFYFSPYFPVMIYRMALTLSGDEGINVASYHTNSIYNSPNTKEKINLTPPTNTQISTTNKTIATSSPLTQTGFYTLNKPNSQQFIGCSLLNANETLVNPNDIKSTIKPIKKGHSISHWLIIAALLIAAIESLLYHRRKVG